MPLHLLGKKSWNVYNPANIARVKRDEAEARARAEAEEQRQQELDAERRLAILRGEVPPPLLSPPSNSETSTHRKRERDDGGSGFRERKKRKRFGEDDTDFEMRVARERTAAAADPAAASTRLSSSVSKTSNAPLVDSRGHIALFPEGEGEGKEKGKGKQGQKNEDAEREAAKKRQELEDQYTMRFANAAGRDGVGVTGSGPWYVSNRGDSTGVQAQIPGKDVWGNEDLKRKTRDAARVVAGDPLAMMKRGAAKVRDVEQERRALNEEKARELRQLRKEEKRHEKRRRHHRHDDVDELEGFTLDGQSASGEDRKRGNGHREHQSRSSNRDERDKHRHRHRSDHDDDRERHRRERHRHESSSHQSGYREDCGDREGHSWGQSRRRSAKTDHY
ncbi:hypothetical protein HD806DRAFT_510066 [Xylariaceae sp. AK1471]|nr:hypothetical protein HD806DRAFT_510066 [Xylariaceae sp. AK1471]